jgi:serine/threonine-protein kinase
MTLEQAQDALSGRYKLERELGRGGMGAVYLARELELDRLVALKVLPPAFAADPVLRDRFLRESRIAASFSHPNIVPVHAVEEHGQVLAFAMGYVEGESLAERVRRNGPLTARDAVRLMHDVSYALAYAHGRGTVHRDIKPDNIMLDRTTNRALVMDFGVARRTDAAPGPAGLTRVGEIVGTPEYMSPEQASGDTLDGRSDLYGLGLVMWFALTGQTAMGGDTAPRILVRQLTEELPSIGTRRSDLPPALVAAVDRCLAKDPAGRFPDANALATALDDAELASPEIPLPIRLLARELMLVSVALPFALLLGIVMAVRVYRGGFANIDPLIPVVVLMAVVLARLGQVLGDAARLQRLGFDPAVVHRGLAAVVDEAASAREAGRLDADLRRDRRSATRTAAAMVVIAVASVVGALALRQPLGPGEYRHGPVGIALLFNGLASTGVALALLLRDPRRMPLGERLYRIFWLQAVGRRLIAWPMESEAARRGPEASRAGTLSGVVSGAQGVPREPSVPDPRAQPDAPTTAAIAKRLDALDRRVRALEASRDGDVPRAGEA